MDREKRIIDRYFKPLAKNKESLNLDNDAAFFRDKKLVISTDMMIEDQHFKKDHAPELIAKKLLRINLSDLAAMGATPYGFFLNIALPKKIIHQWLTEFVKGLKTDMSLFNLKLFGGDLSNSSKIFLNATILGKTIKKTYNKNVATENSSIYVSGKIGDAALGFQIKNKFPYIDINISNDERDYLINKFMLPQPRIKTGKNLNGLVDFCTDISDGLFRELFMITHQSNLQANIFLEKIPISNVIKRLINTDKTNSKKMWEMILTGGEDYELLFGIKNKKLNSLKNVKNISNIGYFSKGKGVKIFNKDGRLINLKKIGFSHF